MAKTIIICCTVAFVCITLIVLSLIFTKRRTVSDATGKLEAAGSENRAAQQSITDANDTVAECRRTSQELGELAASSRRILEEIGKQATDD